MGHKRLRDKALLDEDAGVNWDLSQLKLAPQDCLWAVSDRTRCKACGQLRKYFCYDCQAPLGDLPTPQVRLPIQIEVIRHAKEKPQRSSAIPAKLLSPDVAIHVHPEVPEYDPETTVLLYPSKDATPSDEVDWTRVTSAVLVDCTWYQTAGILANPNLQRLPTVTIKNRKTKFWRVNKISDLYLSTVEAAYWLCRERFDAVEGNGSEDVYSGEYDNLLWYFSFFHQQITKKYTDRGWQFTRKPAFLDAAPADEPDAKKLAVGPSPARAAPAGKGDANEREPSKTDPILPESPDVD